MTAASLLGLAAAGSVQAGTFVYDGRLDEFGQPANGRYDLQISAFGAESGGPRLAEPIWFENVEVKDGRFRVEFDLPLLDVQRAWLALGVRSGAETDGFAAIPGRIKAEAAAAISTCWSSTGDLGSDPFVNFIGTLDNQPLAVRSDGLLSAMFSSTANAMFGNPVADVELTLRGTGDTGSYANLFLEAAGSDTREGILLSAGNGIAGQNNHGFYIDQYFPSSAGQERRFTIEPSGMVTMPGPGLDFGTSTRQMINLWAVAGAAPAYGIGVQTGTQYFRSDVGANFAWFSGGMHNDALGNPGAGGTRPMFLNANGQLELQNSNTQSPRLRLSFGTTGLLASRYWDFIASRTQLSPGGPVIPAGSLIIADDVGLRAAFDINGLAPARVKIVVASVMQPIAVWL